MSDPLPPLAVLHEDRDLVAVAKPPGLPVIAARGEPASACLQKRLERELGRRLWVVHRIDRDASGVVLFARNADAHRAACLAFEHRQVAKSYDAFVVGVLEPWRGRIEVPLHAARKGKARPARPGEPGAQAATTEYTTRQRWSLPPSSGGASSGSRDPSSRGASSGSRGPSSRGASSGSRDPSSRGASSGSRDEGSAVADPSGLGIGAALGTTISLVEARPITGRHHQIRVHLRSAGSPILFDPLYGLGFMPGALAAAPCARLALHARRIDLPAPRGAGRLVVEAPLAPDLAALGAWLEDRDVTRARERDSRG